jgi:hypothetical protein
LKDFLNINENDKNDKSGLHTIYKGFVLGAGKGRKKDVKVDAGLW